MDIVSKIDELRLGYEASIARERLGLGLDEGSDQEAIARAEALTDEESDATWFDLSRADEDAIEAYEGAIEALTALREWILDQQEQEA